MKPTDSLPVEILPEKITPPQELPRTSRARLNRTLQASMDSCNSTIVMGRAGTGKTMLVRDFARLSGRRTCWYKVDAPDAELRVFFRYLCASVAGERPGFGCKTLERLGERVGTEDVPLVVEHFVYELLERDEPLLVVIDDLHLVYDADWVVPFFRRLLPLLPPEVHLILIGRSLPPAPLWRMRSKQTLSVIDESALAFSPEEAARLFESYGLPTATAAAALDETRGRAHVLDARARASKVDEEASKLSAAREDGKRARNLQLVKGFGRNSSPEPA
jgi:LuxR family transcriptional regulator, maltose regulon positive regulatory protein